MLRWLLAACLAVSPVMIASAENATDEHNQLWQDHRKRLAEERRQRQAVERLESTTTTAESGQSVAGSKSETETSE